MIIQRFKQINRQDKKFYEEIVAAIAENPGSCDEVWLCNLFGKPTLKKSEEYIEEMLLPVAELFRSKGVTVSLQIPETIGQREPDGRTDFSGMPPQATYTVNADGETEKGRYCVRNKYFREYYRSLCRLYCEKLHPAAIYFDDDLRVRDWGKAPRCMCPSCLAEFNGKYGYRFTREELAAALKEDFNVRERFLQYSYEGVSEFCGELAAACLEGYPEVRVGMQHGGYSGELNRYCFEKIKEAGAKKTGSRSGAGAYCDKNPWEIADKLNEIEYQLVRLPDFVQERCTEIEGWPHTYYNKTPRGFVLEGILGLAQGFNRISYASVGVNDETDMFRELCRRLSLNRPYLEALNRANADTRRTGFTCFVPERYYETTGEDWYNTGLSGARYGRNWFPFGLPVTYDTHASVGYLLLEEYAELLTDEEIETLLRRPVITTGNAIAALEKRGGKIKEKLGVSAIAVNGGGCAELMADGGRFVGTAYGGAYTKLTGNIKALSYYVLRCYRNLSEEDTVCEGVASAIAVTAYGAKWFVTGYAPKETEISSDKRNLILRAADEICGGLPAYIAETSRLCLYPKADGQGRTTSVTLLNSSIEEAESVELRVKNPCGQKAVWYEMDGAPEELPTQKDGGFILTTYFESAIIPTELSVQKDGDFMTIRLPKLAAWSAGTVFIV